MFDKGITFSLFLTYKLLSRMLLNKWQFSAKGVCCVSIEHGVHDKFGAADVIVITAVSISSFLCKP
jgi:hypothetical protein